MDNSVRIIKLSPNDWEKYRELRLEALKEEPLSFLTSYEEKKNDPPEKWQESLSGKGLLLFAQDSEKLVGMVGAFRETNPRLAHIATIWGMYVNANYRGQGIGKLLLQKILAEIKVLPGIEKIKITVNADKTIPYNLYKSVGFREIGREEKEVKIDDTYFDEVLFEMLT